MKILTVTILLLILVSCVPASKIGTKVNKNSLTNCSGSSIKACTVANGAFNSGTMNASCVNGIWQAPYDVCKISINTNDCLSGFTPAHGLTSCVPLTCSGSSFESCTVTNGRTGTGQRSRSCTNSLWGAPYGPCIIGSSADCLSGYIASGDLLSCVQETCSGQSTEACTVTNGITNSGLRSRTCNNGTWGTPYGNCLIVDESDCLTGYAPSGNLESCVQTTCTGSNISTCTVINGVTGSGERTMTCSNGVYGAPYGTCTIQSNSDCLSNFIPNSSNTACISQGSSLITGQGVTRTSLLILFSDVRISWSRANDYYGYFYQVSGQPAFASVNSSWFSGYNSYNGISSITDFTNASNYTFSDPGSLIFAESENGNYRGILLFKYNDNYGAIEPVEIFVDQSDGLYYLRYNYWYDTSGSSNFSSAPTY